MKQIAIVTGGSSGIGLYTAKALASKGFTVYTLGRKPFSCEGLHHICADVTDEEALGRAVGQILENEQTIDLVINNAGFGISGAVEFTDTAEAQRQFDVNFFGMVRMNHVILPQMRKQGFGRIINISSVAAPLPIPFQTYYSAAKAAIDAYTMALVNELRPYGITVCAIRPGDIATGFTAARKKSTLGDDSYGGRISRSVAKMEHDEQNGIRPEVAARSICRIAMKKSSKPLVTIGLTYRLFTVLAKLLPCRLINYIVGLLYAK
ncbi:MAG: SDR family oxidoreductase [Ruminococcaceae bacterium]|nr:SDR family oxidoreductase [Oscillospiraceae bacterium]